MIKRFLVLFCKKELLSFLVLRLAPPHDGAMEKRKPHYALADVKASFADPATLNRSFVSKQGADALGMDNAAVVATIQGRRCRAVCEVYVGFAESLVSDQF
jgi:hypothetical protein